MRRSKSFLENNWSTLSALVLIAISITLALLRWVGPDNPGVAMVIVALGVLFILAVAALAVLLAENMFEELQAPMIHGESHEDRAARLRRSRASSTAPRANLFRHFLHQVHAEMNISGDGSYFAEEQQRPKLRSRRDLVEPSLPTAVRDTYSAPPTLAQPVASNTMRPVIPHRELPSHAVELTPMTADAGYSRPKPQRRR